VTAIFLAGAEVETLTRALLDNGVKRVLYSYFYIYQMRREGFIARMQEEYKDVEWFLDSGAFTYFAKYKVEPHKLMPWKIYKKLYFNYVGETWERWCRIAELDLDNSFDELTLDVLAEWRDEMVEKWPTAPIMPVWHPNRGPEDWTSVCRDKRFRHLAIGSGSGMDGMLRRMVMEARQRNKTVHGFGMTKVNTSLQKIPYDSVDSTSWLMGQKFGTLFVFQNNKFRLLGKDGSMGKNVRKFYRHHFTRIGIDWRKIEADDTAEVRKANVLAWKHLGDRMIEIRKRQNRTIYGQDRPEVLNKDFTWEAARPRETKEIEGDDHGRWARRRDDVGAVSEEAGAGGPKPPEGAE
jgi:hypothetical protein